MSPLKPQRSPRAGITLIELTISIVASAALVVGLSSGLYLSLNTMSGGQARQETLSSATEILAGIATDLSLATSVDWAGPYTITVEVPDRSGDGDTETIIYSCNTLTGYALTRTCNMKSTVLARGVDSFFIEYYQPAGAPRIVDLSLQLTDDATTTVTTSVALLNTQ